MDSGARGGREMWRASTDRGEAARRGSSGGVAGRPGAVAIRDGAGQTLSPYSSSRRYSVLRSSPRISAAFDLFPPTERRTSMM